MTRDWADAILAHLGEPCLLCRDDWQRHAGRRLELAHTIGRKYDQPHPATRYQKGHGGELYVHPDSVVTLCGPATTTATCHARFDSHLLDLRPHLTPDQLQWAIDRLGHGQAMRALAGRNWHL